MKTTGQRSQCLPVSLKNTVSSSSSLSALKGQVAPLVKPGTLCEAGAHWFNGVESLDGDLVRYFLGTWIWLTSCRLDITTNSVCRHTSVALHLCRWGVLWVSFIPQKLNTIVQMTKICTGRLNTDGILVSGSNGCCQCGEVVLCFILCGPRVLDCRLFLWSLLVPEHLHEEGHV